MIILLILILHCSTGYSQEIKPGPDGWFLIDRKFAENIAAQKDSLKGLKILYISSRETLDACMQNLSDLEWANIVYKEQADLLEKQIHDQQSIIKSQQVKIETLTESRDFLQGALESQSKKNKRKTFWKVGAGIGGGLLVGIITGILIK